MLYIGRKYITNYWREIFDPAAQIFLNSTVITIKILSSKPQNRNLLL